VELTIKRIEMQPAFSVGVIGREKIDQGRAIEELREQTPLGKTLVDIEKYYIQYIDSIARKSGHSSEQFATAGRISW
jgi:hypothetical protein